jgi:Raf kinase inhibitor-like YbhB/YbcL family protein
MKAAFALTLAILLASCGPAPADAPASSEAPMAMNLTSSAFAQGQPIPAQYSCDGKGVSVPLAWTDVPAAAKSLALIMDDPDAPSGTFVHWVIYNIPASSGSLAENISGAANLADGSLQGKNSAARTGYTGPCPPGGTHRYFFKLYALDTMLSLASGAGKNDLLKAMQGHILAQGELMGTFSR